MSNHWLEEAKKRLEAQSGDVMFDRLVESGMINERGEVSGRLKRWDAFLAIRGVEYAADRQRIEVFHCLKPVFGMPGGEPIDVPREKMAAYLSQGKNVITALRDERLEIWKKACDVHLSEDGSIRCDSANGGGDDVGSLP